MRVAIVHYHLGPGGVTRVIEAASDALTTAGIQHVILTGKPPESGWSVPLQTVARSSRPDASIYQIEGLGYLAEPGDLTAKSLVQSLLRAAAGALGGPPDLWHFHNHSLGKNCLIAEVVALLAAAHERLLLQIHDLAEEGRPINYALIPDTQKLYPVSDRIHFAFLNTRDQNLFTQAGLPPQNATLLPNPIALSHPALPTPHSPLLFSPVRGIRRKNLGELVLLSALAPVGTRFAVSRAPLNPDALPVHDAWQKFADRHQLPIEFDVVDRLAPAAGAANDFDSWLAHSTHFASTSVAEGFGLPMLEAAAHGKLLIGRNLAHLSADHACHGIRAGHLYDCLLVPADWIDLTLLRQHLATTLQSSYRTYRRALTTEMIDNTYAALFHGDHLDFGNLPEPIQQAVIEKLVIGDNREVLRVQLGSETRSAQHWLAEVIAQRVATATPAQLAPYSLPEYSKKLIAKYADLVRQPISPVDYLSASRILTAHLAPDSFLFLLSAPLKKCRAVIFDIYGTLLIAPADGVKPDPAADPLLREIIIRHGHSSPQSPSSELHAAVLRHHAAAGVPFPEVDLCELWRQILSLDAAADLTPLVVEIQQKWHPAQLMPGAERMIQNLAQSGVALGLLSNAQCNTLSSLGGMANCFAQDLSILSYQHGIAKPAPELFQMLAARLADRGIAPAETLFVGNDPLHDIIPAAAAGFQTALFIGHPDSLRPGDCVPDQILREWSDLRV